MELFIAAPSSWALLPSARRSPGPPAPAARNTRPSHPPSPNPAPVTWEGGGEGVTHLSQPPLPAPSRGRPDVGERKDRVLPGAGGRGKPKEGPQRADHGSKQDFLQAQPRRQCPLDLSAGFFLRLQSMD